MVVHYRNDQTQKVIQLVLHQSSMRQWPHRDHGASGHRVQLEVSLNLPKHLGNCRANQNLAFRMGVGIPADRRFWAMSPTHLRVCSQFHHPHGIRSCSVTVFAQRRAESSRWPVLAQACMCLCSSSLESFELCSSVTSCGNRSGLCLSLAAYPCGGHLVLRFASTMPRYLKVAHLTLRRLPRLRG